MGNRSLACLGCKGCQTLIWQNGMHLICMEKAIRKLHQQYSTVIVLNLSKTEQMLRIITSYNDTDELLFNLLLAPFFFARAVLRSQHKALCLQQGSRAGGWARSPTLGAACPTGAQQTPHELSLLHHEGLLILQRSPRTADSLEFALTTCLKSGNSEGCSIS